MIVRFDFIDGGGVALADPVFKWGKIVGTNRQGERVVLSLRPLRRARPIGSGAPDGEVESDEARLVAQYGVEG